MYAECRPPAALAGSVECFWTQTPDGSIAHRQQLARRFAETIGVSPKTFARVVRFQALMRQVGAAPNWGALAHGLGFADQSHLVNDFRALAGLTPSAWFQNSKTVTDAPSCFSRSRTSRTSSAR